jgi:Sec-independent protein translocase protein TatA
MSKKDRKIKKLKKEVKELKAELRQLKLASLRRRTTVATAKSQSKSPSRSPSKPQPARLNIDTPPQMAAALKSISAVRPVGQR